MTDVLRDDPDAALVLRAGAGDQAACAALVDRWLRPVHRLAHRVLGNAADADEVAQEAFLRVWQHAPRWKPRAKFSTWLFRMAHNLCVDRLRARRATEDAALDVLGDDGASAREVERHATATSVRAAVASLPVRQRIALTLCHFEELTNIEAAEVMGVSIEALESLLARARRSLRGTLAALLDEAEVPRRE
jgi:RNA polymerase sigma-70 factor, ECF subfamily